MKTFLRILAGILILIILAIFTIPQLFKKQLTELVTEQINNSVNAKVSIGEIDISLLRNFPALTLSVKKVEIKGTGIFEKTNLLSIEDFTFAFNLRSLFGDGGYEVNEIAVLRPNISLLVLPKGEANYDIAIADATDTLVVEEEAVEESESSDLKFKLNSFTIKNANITYLDEQSGMHASILDLNHSLSGDMSGAVTTLKTRTRIKEFSYFQDGIAYLKNANLSYKADLKADLENEVYTLQENTLKINGLALNFDGSVAMLEEAMDLDLTFNSPGSSFKEILSMVPAVYTKDFEDIKTSGSFSFSGAVKGKMEGESLPAFNLELKVNNASFQYPDLPGAVTGINVKTQVSSLGGDADNTVVMVPLFQLKMMDNPISATFHLEKPISNPTFNGNINAEMDLGSVKQVYPMDDELAGKLKANLQFAGKMSDIDAEAYDKLSFKGEMQMLDVRFKSDSMQIDALVPQANMVFNNQKVELKTLRLNMDKNDISASGSLSNFMAYALSDGTLKGRLDLKSEYLNVNDFMPQVEEDTTIVEGAEAETDSEEDTISTEPFYLPSNIDFIMNAEFKEIHYDDFDMSNFNGKLRLKDSKLTMDNINTKTLGGTLRVDGYVWAPEAQDPEVDFQLKVAQLDIPGTYNSFAIVKDYLPAAKNIEGTLSSGFHLNSRLNENMEPITESLAASGLLQTSALLLKETKVLEAIDEYVKYFNIDKWELDPTKLSFEIENGKLKVKPFTTKLNKIETRIYGTTSIDKSIEYYINMKVPAKMAGRAAGDLAASLLGKKAADELMNSTISVPLKVTGTLNNPKVFPGVDKSNEAVVKEESTVKQVAKTVVVDAAKEEGAKLLEDANKEADKIMADAQAQADKLIVEAQKQSDDLKRKAKIEADKAVKEAEKQNPLLGMAAKRMAEEGLKKANAEADKLVVEAKKQSNKILADAQKRADAVKAKAEEKTK